VRKKNRKGGIDWYIHKERILVPLLYPFTIEVKAHFSGIIIMEDKASTWIYHYYNSL